ncbi:hypothetical protein KDA23_06770, partial [Candidatus Saccharibacteria bacterium]|nr:hypothetical protein [Candidatus Saccharibacteria bacterium]
DGAAALYVAGLSLGVASVQECARAAKQKRPTAYTYLEELLKRGLCETAHVNGRRHIRMLNPERLKDELERNMAEAKTYLSDLVELYNDGGSTSRATVLEGMDGISRVYDEAANTNNLRVWSNVGTFHIDHAESFEFLAQVVEKRGITTRELIADTRESKRYSRLVAGIAGPTYHARTATVAGIVGDNFVFDDVVAFFHLERHNVSVVRVEDAQVAAGMKAMFDMAWKTARPFRSVKTFKNKGND